jgi:choline dehydrogenase-like flavoprotein
MFLNLTDGIDGRVTLAGTDARVAPAIDHGYLPVVDAGAFDALFDDAERLLATAAVRNASADGHPGVPTDRRSHVLQMLRSGFHPAGGCGIGAVVDADLAVLGLQGVTIADASVFPTHVTNNPNLTVHVVGEVAAARLRELP